MHKTAMQSGQEFFDCYAKSMELQHPRVIEIGSQNVNGSLRTLFPKQFTYVGVDFAAGLGVDVILGDPYTLPFESECVDMVLSSSCFEHSEMFWVLFLEILRVLRPGGLCYLNVPSNGDFHRWPVDCWRFYPDSGRALVSWARRNGTNALLLESYTGIQFGDQWNDFVAVFLKDERLLHRYPARILDRKEHYTNGVLHGKDGFLNYSPMPEDKKKLAAIMQIIANRIKVS